MTFPGPDWHELRDQVAPYIGERAASLFAYAVAEAAGDDTAVSALGAELVGEDLDHPQVTEAEQLLIDWARLLGSSSAVPPEVTARLEKAFSPALRERLPVFARATVAS